MRNDLASVSKFLSLIFRHQPKARSLRGVPLGALGILLVSGSVALAANGSEPADEPKISLPMAPRPAACESLDPADPRIDKQKPIVYLTYEGRGESKDPLDSRLLEEAKPSQAKPEGKDYRLRLHNNSCWVLALRTFGTYTSRPPEFVAKPKGKISFAVPDGAEIGLLYRIREEEGREVAWAGHMSMVSHLPAGRSAVFPVRKEHLKRKRSIEVGFEFDWEEGQSKDYLAEPPVHQLEYSAYDLPEGVK